jgi:RNA polymerase sigma factor for flagellar operon FliA
MLLVDEHRAPALKSLTGVRCAQTVEPVTMPESTSVDDLVRGNLDLVAMIARQLGRELGVHSAHRQDLESAGREGLVTAAQRFDASRGVPFRRFANYRVRGAMIDSLRRESALPRRAYERLRGLESAMALNETASEDLTAPAAPGATPATADSKLAEHLANLATALATGLVAKAGDDGDQVIAVDPAPSPEESAERVQLRQIVLSALDELPEQERTLIRRHYFEGDRFDEVAAEMGLSKSWASRLHTRAVARLTKRLGG